MTSLLIRNMKTLLSASKFFNSEIPSPNQNRKALIFFKVTLTIEVKVLTMRKQRHIGKTFLQGPFSSSFLR